MTIARIAAAGVLAASLLAAGQARAAELCPTVKRIVAAADATPTWQGVARGATGTAIPAGFSSCATSSYSSSADYTCSIDLTAQTVGPRYDQLVAALNACLASTPAVERDAISTSTTWTLPGGVTVTATRVAQANANTFGVGLGVRRSF